VTTTTDTPPPTRDVLTARLLGSLDALAYDHTHTETCPSDDGGVRRHTSRHPPLVTQLRDTGRTTSEEGPGARAGYDSALPVRVDAVDRLAAIADGAREWLARMGIRPRGDALADLRAIPGGLPVLLYDDLDALTREARAWWCWARTVTGWDSPPWTPHAPCPVCETLGGLRVRLATRTGVCVDCGASWDRDTVEVLGRWVRAWSESHTMSSRC